VAIFNIFSKRRKKERNELPDVYLYDSLPNSLRVQIIQIANETLGDVGEYQGGGRGQIFEFVNRVLCKEYGVFRLEHGEFSTPVFNFFLNTEDIEKALDVVELVFRQIDTFVRQNPSYFQPGVTPPDRAIEELNIRFREHGIGYQYASGQIIRIDSELIHQEVVKPVLQLLRQAKFKGANEEFLSAHAHYREGKFKECLNDCLKAFESTLKVVCTQKRWVFKPTDTAKTLLEIVFRGDLISPFLQSHFTGLRTTLESGVPTVRNKLSGHGQGAIAVEVPEYVAGYALNLTATNILLLVKASSAK